MKALSAMVTLSVESAGVTVMTGDFPRACIFLSAGGACLSA